MHSGQDGRQMLRHDPSKWQPRQVISRYSILAEDNPNRAIESLR